MDSSAAFGYTNILSKESAVGLIMALGNYIVYMTLIWMVHHVWCVCVYREYWQLSKAFILSDQSLLFSWWRILMARGNDHSYASLKCLIMQDCSKRAKLKMTACPRPFSASFSTQPKSNMVGQIYLISHLFHPSLFTFLFHPTCCWLKLYRGPWYIYI